MAIASSHSGAGEYRRLFFSTPELVQRLDLLRHLTENSQLIPLVKGGAGTGKTSLSYRLQTLAGENWALCRIDANPLLYPDQLLNQCALCYGFAVTDGGVEARLLHTFENLFRAGRLPAILVDDAHLLPPETLLVLFRWHAVQAGGFPLVRVVLFADPGIDVLLAGPGLQSLDQQRLYQLDVPLLKLQQIPRFLEYVLAERRRAPHVPLAAGEMSRLYHASGGVPGRLIASLKQTDFSNARGKDGVPIRVRKKRLAGVVLGSGLVLVLLVLMNQDEINRLFVPRAVPEVFNSKPGQHGRHPGLPGDTAGVLAENVESRSTPLIRPLKLPPAPPAFRAADIRLPLPRLSVPVSDSASPPAPGPLPPANFDQKETLPAGVAPPMGGGPGQGAADIKVASVARTVLQPPTAPPAKKAPISVSGPSAPPAGSGEQGYALKGGGGRPPAAADQGWRREAWLLAQDPSTYTIQLLGVRDESALAPFIERHGLEDKAVYFESRSSSKGPWFSLVYGVYPNRQAALAGREGLPAALRKRDVWIRRLGAIQKELRAGQSP